jgi:hypothetical protein
MTKPEKTTVKNMRMSNNIRDAFVAAVMADVPKIDYEQRIRDAVSKLCEKATPPAVKKMLASEELNHWVNKVHINLNHYNLKGKIDFPNEQVSLVIHGPGTEWFHELAGDAISTIAAEWRKSIETRARLKSSLIAVTSNCTTTTQVAEAFPDFARYLPQSEADAARQLPAIANVVDDFAKAGWPKGKKA